MSQFSIKAVSQATGLTVETLRAWERRYDVVRPVRDPSGHRTYSAADVARLRMLRTAVERGHTISRLAPLPSDALTQLIADSDGPLARAPGSVYVERALDAAAHVDPAGVEEAVALALALLPPDEAAQTVLAPLVHEVGERWHRGEFTVAQEHMVTDIVRRIVVAVSRSYVCSDSGPTLVFATLSGERHELGILMCCWLAAARRARTVYLGADCPPDAIASLARDVDAQAVLVSLVMPEELVPAVMQLDELAQRLDGGQEIWIGGTAARAFQPERLPPRCIHLPTQADLEARLDLVAATGR